MDMSEDSKKFLEDIFRSKDKNGNGVIDSRELGSCLEAIGLSVSKDELDFLFTSFDANRDGDIQIEELMAQLDVVNLHSVQGDQMMAAFKSLDRDGFIRGRDLTAALTKPGSDSMKKPEAEELVKKMFTEFDANKDGKLSYPEFVRMAFQHNRFMKLKRK